MPRLRFEPTIPVFEQAETVYALGRPHTNCVKTSIKTRDKKRQKLTSASWLKPVCSGFHNLIRFNCAHFFASCRRHRVLTVTCLDACRCAAYLRPRGHYDRQAAKPASFQILAHSLCKKLSYSLRLHNPVTNSVVKYITGKFSSMSSQYRLLPRV
jgi:hypothetical protein